jgi:hypothetical protein
MNTYPERVLQQAYTWTRGHPRAADGGLALVLLAGSADQIPHHLVFMVGAIAVKRAWRYA